MKYGYLFFLLCSTCFAQETTIEARSARYEEEKIYLEGNVIIGHVLGAVRAQSALLIRNEASGAPVDFSYLELSQEVVATLSNGAQLEGEKLICDYQKMASTLTGNPQVHYSDDKGEVFANSCSVSYEEKKGKVDVQSLTLVGAVRLQNKAQQYACGDRLEYFPDKEEIVLFADEGKKVLFFDKAKGVQLSATKIIARGKESIQGVGEVSFVLKQEELENLKHQFEWK